MGYWVERKFGRGKEEPDGSKEEKTSLKSSTLRDLWVLTLFIQLP